MSRPNRVHPLTVRLTHWLNAVAIFVLLTSGLTIYNASPSSTSAFPPQ